MRKKTPRYTATSVATRKRNDQTLDDLIDALDHIFRVAKSSRSDNRRYRWIAARARCAIEGQDDWREIDHPKTMPRVKRAETAIDSVLDLIDRYSEQRRGIDADELIAKINWILRDQRRRRDYRRQTIDKGVVDDVD